jgi:hypothetical protein
MPHNARVLLLSSAVFFLLACQRNSASAHQALTEWPGYLTASTAANAEILQQVESSGGIVFLYRWWSDGAGLPEPFCLAVTFVTPVWDGWRAQSAGSIGVAAAAGGSGEAPACTLPANHGFIFAYTVGGNVTRLTMAYGMAVPGESVRITWSDETVSQHQLNTAGSVLAVRPETLQVERAELLDQNGAVIAEWYDSSPLDPSP